MRKKEKKAGKKPAKNKNVQDSEMFNFDNEIVIGQAKKQKQEKLEEKIKVKPNKKIDLKKEKRKRRIIVFLKGIAITTIIIRNHTCNIIITII